MACSIQFVEEMNPGQVRMGMAPNDALETELDKSMQASTVRL